MDIEVEEKYIQLRITKTEIIQDLLGKAVENLYQKYYDEYSECLELFDIDFDDGIMFIQIHSKFSEDNFNDKYLFKLCLEDFKRKCGSFLKKIENEVCVNHIKLIYDYHEYDGNWLDGKFYNFCEVGFEISNGEKYPLDYTNGNY